MSITSLMIHTATIHAITDNVDLMGDVRESKGAEGDTVDCRFTPMTHKEVADFAADGFDVSHWVNFDADPSLTNKHLLVYGGAKYRVVDVFNSNEMDLMWTAIAKRHTGEAIKDS